MRPKSLAACLIASLLLLTACKRFDGDQTAPAYITIQGITVADNPNNSRSSLSGFFTNKIDCAELIIYFAGDTAETSLGVYELPCRVPVLRHGTISKLIINPVVKQDGVAATHIYYPYYNVITLHDIPIAIDSTTALGSLVTTYKDIVDVAWEEFFEPGAQHMALDSIVQKIDFQSPNYLDTVRSDDGCGVIRVTSNMTQKNFWSSDTIDLSKYSSDSYLYLELDYWTDIRFAIGFSNPKQSGSTDVTQYALTLLPNKGWDKVYVNLGRLWNQYNSYPYLRLYFSVLNETGKTSGNILLDNMKLVIM